MSKRFWWGLAVSGGLLLGFSFPPLPLAWLAWIALVPLVQLVSHNDWRASTGMVFVAHLIAYLVAGYWVLLHPDPYTRWASTAGIVWLSALGTLPWLAASRTRTSLRRYLSLMAGIGSVEIFQLHSDLGFPWPLLGHTHAAFEPFNQLAEFGGVTGLSIWIVGINVTISYAIDMRRERPWRPVTALALLIIVPTVTGSVRLDSVGGENQRRKQEGLTVVGIQPAIGVRTWSIPDDTTRVDSLRTITRQLLAKARRRLSDIDLIVWPETAIPPIDLGQIDERETLSHLTGQWPTFLLTGGIEVLATTSGSPYRNSVFLINGDSTGIRTYHKRRLVPFAEYVPYSNLLPVLRRLAVPAGGVWGYTPGERQGLFAVGNETRIGTLICFESLFGSMASELARAGASAIVVITQDGWWGNSSGYRQHIAFNRLRAIETRLPVIQVAATGISAEINRRGRLVGAIGWMERGSVIATIPPRRSETLYILLGDWPGYLCLILALFLILSGRFKKYPT